MKKEDIIDALGSVDEKFLIEAQTYRNRSNPSYRPFYSAWIKNAALCLLLLFAAIYLFDFQTNKKPALQQPKSLPKISLDDHPAGSFGYPAFEYFSPSDIVDGNPWEETSALTSLPVFQNTISHDDKYKVSGYSLHHMKDELYAVAERLNINQTKLHVQQNITPYYAWVQADTDAYEITVSQDMITQISFKSANLLPDELRSLSLDCYENNVKIAAYIQKAYADLIDMDDPQLDVSGGNCNIDGQKNYTIRFYDKGETIAQSIQNYNFHAITFFIWEGRVETVHIQHTDLTMKIGEYPVISVAEAEKLLRNGNYIAFFPTGLIKEKLNIVTYSLVYFTAPIYQYFIPYYCFYVELDKEAQADGTSSYGICYVPAISSAYIESMPKNGSLPT